MRENSCGRHQKVNVFRRRDLGCSEGEGGINKKRCYSVFVVCMSALLLAFSASQNVFAVDPKKIVYIDELEKKLRTLVDGNGNLIEAQAPVRSQKLDEDPVKTKRGGGYQGGPVVAFQPRSTIKTKPADKALSRLAKVTKQGAGFGINTAKVPTLEEEYKASKKSKQYSGKPHHIGKRIKHAIGHDATNFYNNMITNGGNACLVACSLALAPLTGGATIPIAVNRSISIVQRMISIHGLMDVKSAGSARLHVIPKLESALKGIKSEALGGLLNHHYKGKPSNAIVTPSYYFAAKFKTNAVTAGLGTLAGLASGDFISALNYPTLAAKTFGAGLTALAAQFGMISEQGYADMFALELLLSGAAMTLLQQGIISPPDAQYARAINAASAIMQTSFAVMATNRHKGTPFEDLIEFMRPALMKGTGNGWGGLLTGLAGFLPGSVNGGNEIVGGPDGSILEHITNRELDVLNNDNPQYYSLSNTIN